MTDQNLPQLSAPAAAAEERRVPVLWRRWAETPPSSPPSSTPAKETIGSVVVAFGLLGLCVAALIGFGQVLAGQTKLHGIVLLATPFVAFMFAGLAVGCCLHVYAYVGRREDEDELQARFWHWWSDTVGGGIIKLLIGAGLVVLGYLALHGLFKALSIGTGLIIALLFGIFLVLCQIAARLR